MLTKENLSLHPNFIAPLISRSVTTNYKLSLTVGGNYDNRNKVESWAYNSDSSFNSEIEREYEYVFLCKDVPCYRVDYSNEEVVELLNAVDSEGEVLVHPSTKMEIVSVSTDSDFEEMGYYEIELKVVK